MKIELQNYNPLWTELFEKEKSSLLSVLPENSVVEHIGSTAVEGLCAKPVIDIMCGIKDFSLADLCVELICELNYEYISKYTETIPERRFLKKYGRGQFHIHLVQVNSGWWARHILFRDILRKEEKTRDEYAALKQKLSKREWADGNEYADAKTEFIRTVELRAASFFKSLE